MGRSRVFSLWGLVGLVLLLAACSPTALEPPAEAAVSPASPAFPALVPATATLPPYPWPTVTPWPTDPPDPTEEPTETLEPLPTQPPTPVVTPIPTAAPPVIPFPDGTTAQPFTLFWREGDVIRSLRSEGEVEPVVFLDPVKEFSLYLTPEEAYGVAWGGLEWGAVSPDGQSLALVLMEEPNSQSSSSEASFPAHIYILDRESRNLHQLVKYGVEPVWSPDGKRLAYRSTETGGLWVADVASGSTGEVYLVDHANEHSLGGFTWSHDSQHLALIDQVIAQSTDLIVVDVEQLSPPQISLNSSTYLFGGPQWSPTGDSIVFVWSAGEGDDGPHLWLITSDGSNQKQLTHSVRMLGELSVWSPNGEWVAFSGAIQYERAYPNLDIWIVNSEGSEIKRVTFDQTDNMAQFGVDALMPQWAPDGVQIIYVRVPFSNPPQGEELGEVWTLSLIDGNEQKLTEILNVFDVGLIISP